MKITKILSAIMIICAAISLNASFISSVSGTDTSSDTYKKTKERGIIVSQDVDGDGIHDSKDDCLQTDICNGKDCQKTIVDSDMDGLLDNIDQCPNSPKDFKVDNTGCSVEVNLNLTFDSGKDTIRGIFSENIDKLINFLEKHENYSVIIEGHTDDVGSSEANMILSQNRAATVKAYLLKKSSIKENRITLKWFGEEQPINKNITTADREENRRVIASLKK